MKKKKNERKKMTLAKETLATLDAKSLEGVGGGAVTCQESRLVCSIQHTCVSCPVTDTCA